MTSVLDNSSLLSDQTKSKYCIYSKRKSKYIDNVLKNFGMMPNFNTCTFIYFLNLFLNNRAVFLKDPTPHSSPRTSKPIKTHREPWLQL